MWRFYSKLDIDPYTAMEGRHWRPSDEKTVYGRAAEFDSPPTPEVHHDLLSVALTHEKVAYDNIDNMESEKVAPVDQRRSPLEFLDEEPKEVSIVGIVQPLDTTLGHYTAVVCLHSRITSVHGQPINSDRFSHLRP